MTRCVPKAVLVILLTVSVVAADEWTIHPSADTVRKVVKDYAPVFEKHFKVADGVLIGTCGLGEDFYKEHKVTTFEGVGQIWATRTDWPTDAADFEFTCEYKWFQDEPMKKYGDFPDLNLGFRLDKDGRGYFLRWGFLGDIIINVMGDDHDYVLGRGLLRGWKDQWIKVRLLCAGPIIKVKMWRADQPEPETWSAEALDDRVDRPAGGAVAVGFSGRKLFDTCVYSFRNANFRTLAPDEAKAVTFFDAKTAPTHVGHTGATSTSIARVAKPETLESIGKLDGWKPDPNLEIVSVAKGLLTVRSKDGKPAYLRKEARALKMFVARMQSSGEARPLIGLRVESPDAVLKDVHIDPAWREGIAALVYEDGKTTASAHKFAFKPDTWYDFAFAAGHWHKWFFHETKDPKALAAFAAVLPGDWYRARKMLLIGVAGSGSVSIEGVSVK